MSTLSNSNSCCFSPKMEETAETAKELDVSSRTKSSMTLSDAHRLSFLDQMYPEPRLLQIECERLRVSRPFVQADRDPANLGMGFAPSVLRRRATAFVSVGSMRPSKPKWEKNYDSLALFEVLFRA